MFCYMTSWSKKRPGAGRFTPDNIEASLCTHIIYAFASLKDHKLVEGEDKEGKDNEKEGDRYKQVVALREKNPNLKVSLKQLTKYCSYFIEICLLKQIACLTN